MLLTLSLEGIGGIQWALLPRRDKNGRKFSQQLGVIPSPLWGEGQGEGPLFQDGERGGDMLHAANPAGNIRCGFTFTFGYQAKQEYLAILGGDFHVR